MAKKVNHTGVMFQFCRNYIVCDNWSMTAHAFIHQNCMATSQQKTNKSDIIWLYTFFTNLFKMFKSFLTMPMHGWHNLQVWQSKLLHFEMTSCWALSKLPQCSHTLHTCQPSYCPCKDLTPNHFEWPADEHTCSFQLQPWWHMHSAPPQK